jgi:cytochrome P450
MGTLAGPPPVSTNPLRRLVSDLRAERAATVPYPPGATNFDMTRTRQMLRDPIPILLDLYARYGPVFSLRTLHNKSVWMLGPEANHYMTVSHAANFSWREGFMGDLMPLLGDGLLTVDGDFHNRSRRIMLPAFHSERIASTLQTMLAEGERGMEGWHDGALLDFYAWARRVALRVAMRALFGLDPDASYARIDPARRFEEALRLYSSEYVVQMLRGPGTPWARMQRARAMLDTLIYSEIARRRESGERGEDVLSLLLDAEGADGERLSVRHVRDEVMTLLFAGHDTTTSTLAFLFHELARHPDVTAQLIAERQRALGGAPPTAAALMGGELPLLDSAIDETLRLYPPAWIGPRQSIEPFEFAGRTVPGGVPVNYCSWASHRLPDVWQAPDEFRPERWSETVPKGAYVPFGGGSRICIGMRFAQLEVKALATQILARFELELAPGYRLRVRQMPTIGPRGGMSMIVRRRREPTAHVEPLAA